MTLKSGSVGVFLKSWQQLKRGHTCLIKQLRNMRVQRNGIVSGDKLATPRNAAEDAEAVAAPLARLVCGSKIPAHPSKRHSDACRIGKPLG